MSVEFTSYAAAFWYGFGSGIFTIIFMGIVLFLLAVVTTARRVKK